MSSLLRAVIDSCLPPGSAWKIAPDQDLDKLFDGSADNWDIIRSYLSELSDTRDPAKTQFLADLEREFGVFTNPNLTDQQRRDQLSPAVFNRSSNGGIDNLQNALNAAGFDVQVHSNSPAVDPDIFLNQNFQMVAAGYNSYAGRSDAFAGREGGELLVNGEIFKTRKIVTSIAGHLYSGTGHGAGEYTDLERTEIVYDIPTDPDDWPLVFFVGGDDTRAGVDFVALGQTSRTWNGMTTGLNGDVYASVENGDIYKQVNGGGDFLALGQTSRDWTGMTTGLNGDVYAAVISGDIYKQTGGVGNFIALGQTSRLWRGMTTGLNGDVYACVQNGDIYKQTGGVGNFIALGQTSRVWWKMATGLNGDVYACVFGGDIYKQTGGVGNFIALGQTSRDWAGMSGGINGDVYADVSNGDIYKQTGGVGDFLAQNQTSRLWRGMTTGANGLLYAAVYNGDIYKQVGGTTGFLTEIEIANIPLNQEQEFKRIILKYKPIHSWAALIINFA